MIPADNYIVAQTANKVLLSPPEGRDCGAPGLFAYFLHVRARKPG
jgi:hypothetical protein